MPLVLNGTDGRKHKHWARLFSQDWAVLSEEETRAPREDWRVNIATALRHPWGFGECLLS